MHDQNLYWVAWSCGDFSRMMNMFLSGIHEATNVTGDESLLRGLWASYHLKLMNRIATCNEAATNFAKIHDAYQGCAAACFPSYSGEKKRGGDGKKMELETRSPSLTSGRNDCMSDDTSITKDAART